MGKAEPRVEAAKIGETLASRINELSEEARAALFLISAVNVIARLHMLSEADFSSDLFTPTERLLLRPAAQLIGKVVVHFVETLSEMGKLDSAVRDAEAALALLASVEFPTSGG